MHRSDVERRFVFRQLFCGYPIDIPQFYKSICDYWQIQFKSEKYTVEIPYHQMTENGFFIQLDFIKEKKLRSYKGKKASIFVQAEGKATDLRIIFDLESDYWPPRKMTSVISFPELVVSEVRDTFLRKDGRCPLLGRALGDK